MTGMEEKFRQAIKESRFNYFEWEGFKTNPELALMAGIAIGYRLGIDEGLEGIKKLMVEVDKFKAVAL